MTPIIGFLISANLYLESPTSAPSALESRAPIAQRVSQANDNLPNYTYRAGDYRRKRSRDLKAREEQNRPLSTPLPEGFEFDYPDWQAAPGFEDFGEPPVCEVEGGIAPAECPTP